MGECGLGNYGVFDLTLLYLPGDGKEGREEKERKLN